jgi:dihydrofolate reductase
MVVSIDGFAESKYKNGGSAWDNQAWKFCIDNLKNVDNILLGRKTAIGFIPYWKKIADKPKHNDYKIGKLLTDIPRVIFSKKLKASKWDNAIIENGDLVKEVKALKRKKGKDMIVYGGCSFVSQLIQNELIDDYYFLVNPYAYGSGIPIFNRLKKNLKLTLKSTRQFPSGLVLLHYGK